MRPTPDHPWVDEAREVARRLTHANRGQGPLDPLKLDLQHRRLDIHDEKTGLAYARVAKCGAAANQHPTCGGPATHGGPTCAKNPIYRCEYHVDAADFNGLKPPTGLRELTEAPVTVKGCPKCGGDFTSFLQKEDVAICADKKCSFLWGSGLAKLLHRFETSWERFFKGKIAEQFKNIANDLLSVQPMTEKLTAGLRKLEGFQEGGLVSGPVKREPMKVPRCSLDDVKCGYDRKTIEYDPRTARGETDFFVPTDTNGEITVRTPIIGNETRPGRQKLSQVELRHADDAPRDPAERKKAILEGREMTREGKPSTIVVRNTFDLKALEKEAERACLIPACDTCEGAGVVPASNGLKVTSKCVKCDGSGLKYRSQTQVGRAFERYEDSLAKVPPKRQPRLMQHEVHLCTCEAGKTERRISHTPPCWFAGRDITFQEVSQQEVIDAFAKSTEAREEKRDPKTGHRVPVWLLAMHQQGIVTAYVTQEGFRGLEIDLALRDYEALMNFVPMFCRERKRIASMNVHLGAGLDWRISRSNEHWFSASVCDSDNRGGENRCITEENFRDGAEKVREILRGMESAIRARYPDAGDVRRKLCKCNDRAFDNYAKLYGHVDSCPYFGDPDPKVALAPLKCWTCRDEGRVVQDSAWAQCPECQGNSVCSCPGDGEIAFADRMHLNACPLNRRNVEGKTKADCINKFSNLPPEYGNFNLPPKVPEPVKTLAKEHLALLRKDPNVVECCPLDKDRLIVLVKDLAEFFPTFLRHRDTIDRVLVEQDKIQITARFEGEGSESRFQIEASKQYDSIGRRWPVVKAEANVLVFDLGSTKDAVNRFIRHAIKGLERA